MPAEISLVISSMDQVLQTISKEICEVEFVKSIESFQVIANAALTQMIQDSGATAGDCEVQDAANVSDSDDLEEEDEDNVCVTPKKKKK